MYAIFVLLHLSVSITCMRSLETIVGVLDKNVKKEK